MTGSNIVSKERKEDKIRYTLKTTMTITIRSKMTTPIVEGGCYEPAGKTVTRAFQKKMHEGIAWAIFNNIEWARDDNEKFDQMVLEHTEIESCGIEEPEISDYAEINLEYKHEDTTWQGERIPTRAERNEGMITVQNKESC